MSKKVRLLIVDDSELIQSLFSDIASNDPEIEVVGVASDPYEARDLIKIKKPDVITLDIEMPKMDGITFLKKLMALNPMPVIMISNFTVKGAKATLECLEHGAVDFLPKPKFSDDNDMYKYGVEFMMKVKSAAQVDVKKKQERLKRLQGNITTTIENYKPPSCEVLDNSLIAIGASTGGTEAIKLILESLPSVGLPPIVITQHIPSNFSSSFAERLVKQTGKKVLEVVKRNTPLMRDHVYLAEGSTHLEVKMINGKMMAYPNNSEPIHHHRPAIDFMYRSIFKAKVEHVIPVLLTGMGADGAEGMALLKSRQAHTIAQDEASSVIWGIPKSAIDKGCVDYIVSLREIPNQILSLLEEEL